MFMSFLVSVKQHRYSFLQVIGLLWKTKQKTIFQQWFSNRFKTILFLECETHKTASVIWQMIGGWCTSPLHEALKHTGFFVVGLWCHPAFCSHSWWIYWGLGRLRPIQGHSGLVVEVGLKPTSLSC